jgi:hypothetical protein
MALGSTQPLTQMSTRNLPGGKKRPAPRADNLASSTSQLSRKCGSLDVSQPYWPAQPGKGIALLSLIIFSCVENLLSLISSSFSSAPQGNLQDSNYIMTHSVPS